MKISQVIFLSCVGGLLIMNTISEAATAKGTITLSWHGQACYYLISPGGKKVFIDPIPDSIGYNPPSLEADVVTVSHEHFDHANVELAKGQPIILRGLAQDLKSWQSHDKRLGDIRIRNVGVYHDNSQGKERGLNSIFIYEVAGLKLAHLGDLGHLLTSEQLKKVGPVDVVMIPVGGFYTIDAKQAHAVIAQLKPKYMILPMHYRTDVLTIKELATIDDFIQNRKDVEKVSGNTLKIDRSKLPTTTKIILLNYK
ncbi:MAG: MBL fold metallo-hydrolase [Elusimicrobia bacterium]|nr:MBL fold metallo-hydrolase [Elusimicrobiota bacterium]